MCMSSIRNVRVVLLVLLMVLLSGCITLSPGGDEVSSADAVTVVEEYTGAVIAGDVSLQEKYLHSEAVVGVRETPLSNMTVSSVDVINAEEYVDVTGDELSEDSFWRSDDAAFVRVELRNEETEVTYDRVHRVILTDDEKWRVVTHHTV